MEIFDSNRVKINNNIQLNSISLKKELEWFSKVLNARIEIHFENENHIRDIQNIPPPDLPKDSFYAQFVQENKLNNHERLILILALIPHIKPQALDVLFTTNPGTNKPFSEFGGWKGNNHNGFLPTGETAAFLITGANLQDRFELIRYFSEDHIFSILNIVFIKHMYHDEPFFSGTLAISSEYLYMFTTGSNKKPDFDANFPARRITTKLNWEDLVLSTEVFDEIEDIISWIKHSALLMNDWGMEKVLKPGYRSLFYGPPGTGKTLTATLIGKLVDMDVYRIDLSMVVSKYIGETEKNLENIFKQAENKQWVLFFDEADALFGKRTSTSSSHDKYANQEVSYLLQRIEDFDGIVILATNQKANMDEAFTRRFQSVIYFPMPEPHYRLQLWSNILPDKCKLDESINLKEIAEKYELSGGSIINIVRYTALRSVNNERKIIKKKELYNGIVKELKKSGKTI